MATINMPKKVKYNLIELELGGKGCHAKVDDWQGAPVSSLRFTWEPEPGKTAYTRHGINIPLYESGVAIEALIQVINEATGSDLMLVNRHDIES